MKTIKIDINKTKSFIIGQQGDHNCTQVEFINLPTYDEDAELYIYTSIEDYENLVPLTDNTFIIGNPLTMKYGAVTSQILMKTTDGSFIKLTEPFYMNVLYSPGYNYNTTEDYPIDPNIKTELDLCREMTDELTNLLNTYTTMPNDIKDLQDRVTALENKS